MLEETIAKISLSTEPNAHPPLSHSPADSPVSAFLGALAYKAIFGLRNISKLYSACRL